MNGASVASACAAFPKVARRFGHHAGSEDCRTFEVVTNVEVLKPSGVTRVWILAALSSPTPFQKTIANTFAYQGRAAKLNEGNADLLGIIYTEFAAGVRSDFDWVPVDLADSAE